MEVYRRSSGLVLLLGLSLLATILQGVQAEVELEGPSESECRPYIEKALKELETGEPADTGSSETGDGKEDIPTVEVTDDFDHQQGDGDDNDSNEDGKESAENLEAEAVVEHVSEQDNANQQQDQASAEDGDQHSDEKADDEPSKEDSKENDKEDDKSKEDDGPASVEDDKDSKEGDSKEDDSKEGDSKGDSKEEDNKEGASQEGDSKEGDSKEADSKEGDTKDDDSKEGASKEEDSKEDGKSEEGQEEDKQSVEDGDSKEGEGKDEVDSKEDKTDESKEDDDSHEDAAAAKDDSIEAGKSQESAEDDKGDSKEDTKDDSKEDAADSKEDAKSTEEQKESEEDSKKDEDDDSKEKVDDSKENSKETKEADSKEDSKEADDKSNEKDNDSDEKSGEDGDSAPEEELGLDIDIPTELKPRDHVEQLLKLDDESVETEQIINKVSEITLKELKKLYENAIKPLEVLYKYRDLSNRHFGDSEIFSKPLILFMGPWSGGKSSIINYIVNNEYNETSLRTGAEPSPAYFNILMYGDEPEIIDGTELAADFTFSGLQKFGQGLEERLRGVKLPTKLLEKVNIVEIPGILEVRKQVSRVFPFNDACQWFIDRADIIFLVYDPSKLDVGPETEAILDQLKGREHQTRIILNKADQVKPEELMRVQGALIWNISPLMSSPQPPIMYTTSLWSRPYEPWAPVRLLQAQERAFLRDLRGAIDKRIENKIASARRFAVRVRNHAKMVDCYLTTYYNHKSVFGNRKQVADQIIQHPQDYHIYEGLSTLTNISRYDLPDPEVYKDFFQLNALYDFQQLSATCTYFRGCPINRLDVAIAYDLPELVGTHRRLVENALTEASQSTSAPGS